MPVSDQRISTGRRGRTVTASTNTSAAAAVTGAPCVNLNLISDLRSQGASNNAVILRHLSGARHGPEVAGHTDAG